MLLYYYIMQVEKHKCIYTICEKFLRVISWDFFLFWLEGGGRDKKSSRNFFFCDSASSRKFSSRLVNFFFLFVKKHLKQDSSSPLWLSAISSYPKNFIGRRGERRKKYYMGKINGSLTNFFFSSFVKNEDLRGVVGGWGYREQQAAQTFIM